MLNLIRTALVCFSFCVGFAVMAADTPAYDANALKLVETAKTQMADKKYEAAAKSLRKAKKLDDSIPAIYTLLGDYHAVYSRDYKAEKFYKKAEELKKQAVAGN